MISIVKYVVKHGLIRRRRPHLGRIVRSAAFSRASGQTAGWIDGQFSQIERAAPWLDRAGQEVHHYVLTAARPRGVLRGGTLTAAPARLVTTVYAGPGDLAGPLEALQKALSSQGWGGFSPSPVTVYRPPVPIRPPPSGPPLAALPPPARASWLPDDGRAGAPGTIRDDGGRDLFRGSLAMDIGWAGRDDPLGPVAALASTSPDGGQVTPFYRPVEYRSADIPGLARRILEAGESVIAIRIAAHYTVT